MHSGPSTHQALLDALDRIATTHGSSHPELLGDLQQLRNALIEAHRRNARRELAQAALQVASWVKFIFDHL